MALQNVQKRLLSPGTKMLTNLTNQGVRLWMEAGQLRFHAPKGVMTAVLIAQLRKHREELISQLSATANATLLAVRKPGRCVSHLNAAMWQDREITSGRIRTTCRLCGAFVGYRPVQINKRRSS